MVQQLTLPMSNKYDNTGTATEWDTYQIPRLKGSIGPNTFIYDEERNCIWCIGSATQDDGTTYQSVNQIFLNNYSIKTYKITEINSLFTPVATALFLYKSELYLLVSSASRDYTIKKINLESLTTTNLKTFTIAYVSRAQTISNFIDLGNGIFIVAIPQLTTQSGMLVIELYLYNIVKNEVKSVGTQVFGDFLNASLERPFIQYYPEKEQVIFTTGITKTPTYGLASYIYDVSQRESGVVTFIKSVNIGAPFSYSALRNGISTAPFGNKTMYILYDVAGAPGGKSIGLIDLYTGEIDVDTIKATPPTWYQAQVKILTEAGNKYYIQTNGDIASLDSYPIPPENKARIIKIFKGQEVNTWYRDIEFLPLASKGQPSFSLTQKSWIADRDYDIHLGQYNLKGQSETITIVNK